MFFSTGDAQWPIDRPSPRNGFTQLFNVSIIQRNTLVFYDEQHPAEDGPAHGDARPKVPVAVVFPDQFHTQESNGGTSINQHLFCVHGILCGSRSDDHVSVLFVVTRWHKHHLYGSFVRVNCEDFDVGVGRIDVGHRNFLFI